MEQLTVAFDAGLPLARWGPLFHVLCLERPGLRLQWRPVGFPTSTRPLLDGADVGLFLEPPDEHGLSALTLEASRMVVVMAAGHPLAQQPELRVADILDQPFLRSRNIDPRWCAFWTLDAQRGGPPRCNDDDVDVDVENAEQGLEAVVSGRAIATLAASLANGLAHPGVVAIPLVDGPLVATRLVWPSATTDPVVRCLVDLAQEMRGDLEDDQTA
jgi:DNA-binding transcriptional LysR family regulator